MAGVAAKARVSASAISFCRLDQPHVRVQLRARGVMSEFRNSPVEVLEPAFEK
jgi:hypothetical protein